MRKSKSDGKEYRKGLERHVCEYVTKQDCPLLNASTKEMQTLHAQGKTRACKVRPPLFLLTSSSMKFEVFKEELYRLKEVALSSRMRCFQFLQPF